MLRGWRYHKYLESVTLAGSHAKGTDLKDSDVDIFLRLSPATPGPLSDMQTSLADHFHGQVRNVSVRIAYKGLTVDLVPARANILWQARFNTWLKTDIDKQIRYVRSSGLIDPANSSNVVSDLLTEVERLRTARTARLSVWGKWRLPTDFEERPRR